MSPVIVGLVPTIQPYKTPRLIIWAAVSVFLIDRLLKRIALDEARAGWEGVVQFGLFLNRGFAFSLGRPSLLFWAILAVAFALVGYSLGQELRGRRWPAAAWLAMAMLGGLSNLIDRLAYGATVDYLIFFSLSAINLADVLIVAGLLGWLTRGVRSCWPEALTWR